MDLGLDLDFVVGAGKELVLDVDARGLLGVGADVGGGTTGSSSEEQRSITSVVALACFENRALRLGPLLGDGGRGDESLILAPILPEEEVGWREEDDAVVDEGGLRLILLFNSSRDGSGELGGGGVSVEVILILGRCSSGSSSSSGDEARCLWVWGRFKACVWVKNDLNAAVFSPAVSLVTFFTFLAFVFGFAFAASSSSRA